MSRWVGTTATSIPNTAARDTSDIVRRNNQARRKQPSSNRLSFGSLAQGPVKFKTSWQGVAFGDRHSEGNTLRNRRFPLFGLSDHLFQDDRISVAVAPA
jgi:hypothetical protein